LIVVDYVSVFDGRLVMYVKLSWTSRTSYRKYRAITEAARHDRTDAKSLDIGGVFRHLVDEAAERLCADIVVCVTKGPEARQFYAILDVPAAPLDVLRCHLEPWWLVSEVKPLPGGTMKLRLETPPEDDARNQLLDQIVREAMGMYYGYAQFNGFVDEQAKIDADHLGGKLEDFQPAMPKSPAVAMITCDAIPIQDVLREIAPWWVLKVVEE